MLEGQTLYRPDLSRLGFLHSAWSTQSSDSYDKILSFLRNCLSLLLHFWPGYMAPWLDSMSPIAKTMLPAHWPDLEHILSSFASSHLLRKSEYDITSQWEKAFLSDHLVPYSLPTLPYLLS